MAYSRPPSKSIGDTLTAAEWVAYVRDNFTASAPDAFAAKGDLFVGTAADTGQALSVGTDGQRLAADSSEATGLKWADDFYVISMILYAGGGVLAPAINGDIEVPMNGTIQRVTVLPDGSGTLLVSLYKNAYSSFPPTSANSIVGSNAPGVFAAGASISGTVSKSIGSATLSGSGTSFLTQLAAGDVIDVPGGTATERMMVIAVGSNTSATIHKVFSTAASGQTCTRHQAASKYQDTGLAGWTPTLTAGDILRIYTEYGAGITRATLSLLVKKS